MTNSLHLVRCALIVSATSGVITILGDGGFNGTMLV